MPAIASGTPSKAISVVVFLFLNAQAASYLRMAGSPEKEAAGIEPGSSESLIGHPR